MATAPKESATFVFHGTVKSTKAANLKVITDTDRTAVVTVKKVVRCPRALATFAGQDVTVHLAAGERVVKGQQALFFTNGWIFGENLAVQSLGHDAVAAPAAAVAAAAQGPESDPTRALRQQEIRERAAAAPVVVTGKVVAIGLPQSETVAAVAAAAPGRPISEHDPFWREAIVEVQAVHKGSVTKPQLVLRFPSSSDVRWHRSPKFQAGQQGVFTLHPDSVSGHEALGLAAASLATDVGTYTALHTADFQPSDHEAEAAAAVSAAKP
jgi:hypothetical protein